MAKDPQAMINHFNQGLAAVSSTNKEAIDAFMNSFQVYGGPGIIDVKTKELISVAISCYNRCEYCIVFHVYNALQAGATRAEIMEAAMVAVAFGGGPSIAYAVTLLKDSIDAFEPGFK